MRLPARALPRRRLREGPRDRGLSRRSPGGAHASSARSAATASRSSSGVDDGRAHLRHDDAAGEVGEQRGLERRALRRRARGRTSASTVSPAPVTSATWSVPWTGISVGAAPPPEKSAIPREPRVTSRHSQRIRARRAAPAFGERRVRRRRAGRRRTPRAPPRWASRRRRRRTRQAVARVDADRALPAGAPRAGPATRRRRDRAVAVVGEDRAVRRRARPRARRSREATAARPPSAAGCPRRRSGRSAA